MSLLNAIYRELDYNNGDLALASDSPKPAQTNDQWLNQGEWLAAAKRAGAEKLFFIDNNPLIVFSSCGSSFKEKTEAFNRAWSLARPRLLFLETPGELTVYDLARSPVRSDKPEELSDNELPPRPIKTATEIAELLQDYHRNEVESGRLFADRRFGDLKNRADKALIRDLKIVRTELMNKGLDGQKVHFAHALIGRSIFIRYLEDRGVLDETYFLNIARQTKGWTDILKTAPTAILGNETHPTLYPRVLANKDFTYALFRKLAKDFNGDMFPDVDEEYENVDSEHLALIQSMLYGDAEIQTKLFLSAYHFDVVPLDLISAIYEEFYHSDTEEDSRKTKARQDGAYYTPPVLAEFVLSRLLTAKELKKKPRILDPSCGSGIFLVEAFRRIVRYEWKKKGESLNFEELRAILKDQIAGIEVNPEAARIAAFSLYLSMLHYLDPPAISQLISNGEKLPNLLVHNGSSPNYFHSVWIGNSFDTETIESKSVLREKFGRGCADIVVGNPPWGSPGRNADVETKERHQLLIQWCSENNKNIGDKEASQAFLLRALDFVGYGGKIGMLVSAGVLFKHGSTSQIFRKDLLASAEFSEVFNFSHVRKLFFKGAISPFLALFIEKGRTRKERIPYWSAKETTQISKNQAVLFSIHDRALIRRDEAPDSLEWKRQWFGRLKDSQFVYSLHSYQRLSEIVDRSSCGRGFETASQTKNSDSLENYRQVSINSFSRYGELSLDAVPKKVYRYGNLNLYDSGRMLVGRGIDETNVPKGQIVARYETDSFCFTNAILGFKLNIPEEWKYKLLLGILWSSFSRYFYFMTSSNWGLWHHEIHLDELLQLPVVLDKNHPQTKNIIRLVDKLRAYNPEPYSLQNMDDPTEEQIETNRREWERELDNAIYDLFGFDDEQRDLIEDFCNITLPFFYKPIDSKPVEPVSIDDDVKMLDDYAKVFCRKWAMYLYEGDQMQAKAHIGAHDSLVAVEFTIHDRKKEWTLSFDNEDWSDLLNRLSRALPKPMGTSQILLDGLVHVITDESVIVIKRNEKRFWTKSLAREDAEATLAKRMIDTMPAKNEGSTDGK